MRSLLAALQFLTVFPWPPGDQICADEIGRASIFFPLVGFCLGAILVLMNWGLDPYIPSQILSVALVTTLALLSHGLHLDGLSDTFDGLGAGGDRQRVLQVMDDSHAGVFGLLAVLLILLFKIRAIEVMSEERWRALLLAPVLGRWAMVVLAYRSEPAKEGLGWILLRSMRGSYLLVATVLTLIMVLAFSGQVGLGIMLSVAIFAIISKRYFHRRLGGVTGDTFGAVGEISEASALVVFSLAQ